MLIELNKPKLRIEIDSSPRKYLFVCSHERSGTHFLMNSVSLNSDYTVKPFLNFDLFPLGDIVNFYSPKSISGFFDGLDNIAIEGKKAFLKGIVKSHHSHHFFREQFLDDRFVFLYIHRNPIDTLISFWKFLHRWDWDEGAKLDNLLEFITSAPEGQLMRYQDRSMENHFTRWAYHQVGWLEAAERHKNILCVSYSRLRDDYANEITRVLKFVDPGYSGHPEQPGREDFILGTEKRLDDVALGEFKDIVSGMMASFPVLQDLYQDDPGKH